MGIKHFFPWLKRNFKRAIVNVVEPLENIDVLGIDINGILHPISQKIYQYGSHQRLLQTAPIPNETEFFEAVCQEIFSLVQWVRPKKGLLLCVDGVAGYAKMCQQRQRRFLSSLEHASSRFNRNILSPGTAFMYRCCQYIEFYITKRLLHEWRHLFIFFSNVQCPGEGEHAITNFIKQHGNPADRYCIYALDGDLIMLGLACSNRHILIMRDRHCCVDIDILGNLLEQCEKNSPSTRHSFILKCFAIGNDFLPQIHCLGVYNGGLDIIMQCEHVEGNLSSIASYFKQLAKYEIPALEKHFQERHLYFPDEMHEYFTADGHIQWEEYRQNWYMKKFGSYSETTIEKICRDYIRGILWVYQYYVENIPDWQWYYPYYDAPLLSDLAYYTDKNDPIVFERHLPVSPFFQLLTILPLKDVKTFLPTELHEILDNPVLQTSFQQEIVLDNNGKKYEYEQVVRLTLPDLTVLVDVYTDVLKHSQQSWPFNCLEEPRLFQFGFESQNKPYKNHYGVILHPQLSIQALSVSGEVK